MVNALADLAKGMIGIAIFTVFATLPFLAPFYLVTLSKIFLRVGQLFGDSLGDGTKSVEQHVK